MSPHKHSALYSYIESLHGDQSWGRFLDAGTGVNSIRWVLERDCTQWIAVTGAKGDADRVRTEAGPALETGNEVLLGNWADRSFLDGEVFDTVLADYLIGAIEGFAPYFQTYMFARLRALTGKVLYLTGLEPYVPIAQPESLDGQLVWQIGRLRDACLLLTGTSPYREYPAPWVADQLQRNGFAVQSVKHFKIGYKARFVNSQIDMCLTRLKRHDDRAVAEALTERAEALRAQALSAVETNGALRFCRNYVIEARPV